MFPPQPGESLPAVGVVTRKEGESFTVTDIDRPSVWVKETFSTALEAARRYLHKRVDPYWLEPESDDQSPKFVRYSWD
jgi:hypothetical protein